MADDSINVRIERAFNEGMDGIFTVSVCIVEQIDHDLRRAELSLKRTDGVRMDEVPIASVFARPEYGQIVPIEKGDEVFALHTKIPLDEIIVSRGHTEPEYKDRQFDLDDAIVLPMFWNENDTLPDYEPGEYGVFHPSDSQFHIYPDGRIVHEHVEGHVTEINATEMTSTHAQGYRSRIAESYAGFQSDDENREIVVNDVLVKASVKRGDGEKSVHEVREDRTRSVVPDVEARQSGRQDDPYVRLVTSDDGKIRLKGDVSIGNDKAKRHSSKDPDQSLSSKETGEDVEPMVDPQQENNWNPPSATVESPVDQQFFEMRNSIPERRMDHPDPSVNNPDSDQYIEMPFGMNEIPNGYVYQLITEDYTEYKWIDGTYEPRFDG